jgi:hypothetical protein
MRRSTRGRPPVRCGCVHLRRTSSRCQRSSVWGVTINPFRRRGWEHPAERREESAIGCPKRRPPRLLPTKHQQLMAQNEQFDILGELAAPAAHEQLQQR